MYQNPIFSWKTGGIKMQRKIELFQKLYTVTSCGTCSKKQLQIEDNEPQLAKLSKKKDGCYIIRLGDQTADIKMHVKGDTAYIKAFGQIFTLDIINPVDMAAKKSDGSSNICKAPMPGTIISIDTISGEKVAKGQAIVTIESMKLLTVISAPQDGEVEKIHFEPGETFDKNATLVTFKDIEEK